MSTTRIGTVLAGLAMVALAGLAAPAGAQAATSFPASPTRAGQAQADGYFYAWIDANFSGDSCRWDGNAADWGRCRNHASSVWNNGYAGGFDAVNMYWDANYGGAWYCLPRGHYLRNMEYDHFNRGSGLPGFGQKMNDNVSSHRWGSGC